MINGFSDIRGAYTTVDSNGNNKTEPVSKIHGDSRSASNYYSAAAGPPEIQTAHQQPALDSMQPSTSATSWNYNPYLSGSFYNYYPPNNRPPPPPPPPPSTPYDFQGLAQYENQKSTTHQYAQNFNHQPPLHSTSVLHCCDPRCQMLPSEHSKYHPVSSSFMYAATNKPSQRRKHKTMFNMETSAPNLAVEYNAAKCTAVASSYVPAPPAFQNDLSNKFINQPTSYDALYQNSIRHPQRHSLLAAEPTVNDFYPGIGKNAYWNKHPSWNRNVVPSTSYYPTAEQTKQVQQKMLPPHHRESTATAQHGILFNRLLDHHDNPAANNIPPPDYYQYGRQYAGYMENNYGKHSKTDYIAPNQAATFTNNCNPYSNSSYHHSTIPFNELHYASEVNLSTPTPTYSMKLDNLPRNPATDEHLKTSENNNKSSKILDKNPNLDVREFLSTWDDVEDDKIVESSGANGTTQSVIVLDCTSLEGDTFDSVKEKLENSLQTTVPCSLTSSVPCSSTSSTTGNRDGISTTGMKMSNDERLQNGEMSQHFNNRKNVAAYEIAAAATGKDWNQDKNHLTDHHEMYKMSLQHLPDKVNRENKSERQSSSHLDGSSTLYNGKRKDDMSYDIVEMTERLVNTVDRLFSSGVGNESDMAEKLTTSTKLEKESFEVSQSYPSYGQTGYSYSTTPPQNKKGSLPSSSAEKEDKSNISFNYSSKMQQAEQKRHKPEQTEATNKNYIYQDEGRYYNKPIPIPHSPTEFQFSNYNAKSYNNSKPAAKNLPPQYSPPQINGAEHFPHSPLNTTNFKKPDCYFNCPPEVNNYENVSCNLNVQKTNHDLKNSYSFTMNYSKQAAEVHISKMQDCSVIYSSNNGNNGGNFTNNPAPAANQQKSTNMEYHKVYHQQDKCNNYSTSPSPSTDVDVDNHTQQYLVNNNKHNFYNKQQVVSQSKNISINLRSNNDNVNTSKACSPSPSSPPSTEYFGNSAIVRKSLSDDDVDNADNATNANLWYSCDVVRNASSLIPKNRYPVNNNFAASNSIHKELYSLGTKVVADENSSSFRDNLDFSDAKSLLEIGKMKEANVATQLPVRADSHQLSATEHHLNYSNYFKSAMSDKQPLYNGVIQKTGSSTDVLSGMDKETLHAQSKWPPLSEACSLNEMQYSSLTHQKDMELSDKSASFSLSLNDVYESDPIFDSSNNANFSKENNIYNTGNYSSSTADGGKCAQENTAHANDLSASNLFYNNNNYNESTYPLHDVEVPPVSKYASEDKTASEDIDKVSWREKEDSSYTQPQPLNLAISKESDLSPLDDENIREETEEIRDLTEFPPTIEDRSLESTSISLDKVASDLIDTGNIQNRYTSAFEDANKSETNVEKCDNVASIISSEHNVQSLVTNTGMEREDSSCNIFAETNNKNCVKVQDEVSKIRYTEEDIESDSDLEDVACQFENGSEQNLSTKKRPDDNTLKMKNLKESEENCDITISPKRDEFSIFDKSSKTTVAYGSSTPENEDRNCEDVSTRSRVVFGPFLPENEEREDPHYNIYEDRIRSPNDSYAKFLTHYPISAKSVVSNKRDTINNLVLKHINDHPQKELDKTPSLSENICDDEIADGRFSINCEKGQVDSGYRTVIMSRRQSISIDIRGFEAESKDKELVITDRPRLTEKVCVIDDNTFDQIHPDRYLVGRKFEKEVEMNKDTENLLDINENATCSNSVTQFGEIKELSKSIDKLNRSPVPVCDNLDLMSADCEITEEDSKVTGQDSEITNDSKVDKPVYPFTKRKISNSTSNKNDAIVCKKNNQVSTNDFTIEALIFEPEINKSNNTSDSFSSYSSESCCLSASPLSSLEESKENGDADREIKNIAEKHINSLQELSSQLSEFDTSDSDSEISRSNSPVSCIAQDYSLNTITNSTSNITEKLFLDEKRIELSLSESSDDEDIDKSNQVACQYFKPGVDDIGNKIDEVIDFSTKKESNVNEIEYLCLDSSSDDCILESHVPKKAATCDGINDENKSDDSSEIYCVETTENVNFYKKEKPESWDSKDVSYKRKTEDCSELFPSKKLKLSDLDEDTLNVSNNSEDVDEQKRTAFKISIQNVKDYSKELGNFENGYDEMKDIFHQKETEDDEHDDKIEESDHREILHGATSRNSLINVLVDEKRFDDSKTDQIICNTDMAIFESGEKDEKLDRFDENSKITTDIVLSNSPESGNSFINDLKIVGDNEKHETIEKENSKITTDIVLSNSPESRNSFINDLKIVGDNEKHETIEKENSKITTDIVLSNSPESGNSFINDLKIVGDNEKDETIEKENSKITTDIVLSNSPESRNSFINDLKIVGDNEKDETIEKEEACGDTLLKDWIRDNDDTEGEKLLIGNESSDLLKKTEIIPLQMDQFSNNVHNDISNKNMDDFSKITEENENDCNEEVDKLGNETNKDVEDDQERQCDENTEIVDRSDPIFKIKSIDRGTEFDVSKSMESTEIKISENNDNVHVSSQEIVYMTDNPESSPAISEVDDRSTVAEGIMPVNTSEQCENAAQSQMVVNASEAENDEPCKHSDLAQMEENDMEMKQNADQVNGSNVDLSDSDESSESEDEENKLVFSDKNINDRDLENANNESDSTDESVEEKIEQDLESLSQDSSSSSDDTTTDDSSCETCSNTSDECDLENLKLDDDDVNEYSKIDTDSLLLDPVETLHTFGESVQPSIKKTDLWETSKNSPENVGNPFVEQSLCERSQIDDNFIQKNQSQNVSEDDTTAYLEETNVLNDEADVDSHSDIRFGGTNENKCHGIEVRVMAEKTEIIIQPEMQMYADFENKLDENIIGCPNKKSIDSDGLKLGVAKDPCQCLIISNGESVVHVNCSLASSIVMDKSECKNCLQTDDDEISNGTETCDQTDSLQEAENSCNTIDDNFVADDVYNNSFLQDSNDDVFGENRLMSVTDNSNVNNDELFEENFVNDKTEVGNNKDLSRSVGNPDLFPDNFVTHNMSSNDDDNCNNYADDNCQNDEDDDSYPFISKNCDTTVGSISNYTTNKSCESGRSDRFPDEFPQNHRHVYIDDIPYRAETNGYADDFESYGNKNDTGNRLNCFRESCDSDEHDKLELDRNKMFTLETTDKNGEENGYYDNSYFFDSCIEENFVDQNIDFVDNQVNFGTINGNVVQSPCNLKTDNNDLTSTTIIHEDRTSKSCDSSNVLKYENNNTDLINRNNKYPILYKRQERRSRCSIFHPPQIKVQLSWNRIFNLGRDDNSSKCSRDDQNLELGPAKVEVRLSSEQSHLWKVVSSENESPSPVSVKVKRLIFKRAPSDCVQHSTQSTVCNTVAQVVNRKGPDLKTSGVSFEDCNLDSYTRDNSNCRLKDSENSKLDDHDTELIDSNETVGDLEDINREDWKPSDTFLKDCELEDKKANEYGKLDWKSGDTQLHEYESNDSHLNDHRLDDYQQEMQQKHSKPENCLLEHVDMSFKHYEPDDMDYHCVNRYKKYMRQNTSHFEKDGTRSKDDSSEDTQPKNDEPEGPWLNGYQLENVETVDSSLKDHDPENIQFKGVKDVQQNSCEDLNIWDTGLKVQSSENAYYKDDELEDAQPMSYKLNNFEVNNDTKLDDHGPENTQSKDYSQSPEHAHLKDSQPEDEQLSIYRSEEFEVKALRKTKDYEPETEQLNVPKSKYVEIDGTKLGDDDPKDMQINVDRSKDVEIEDTKLGDNEAADIQINVDRSKDVEDKDIKLVDNEPKDMQINIDRSKYVEVEDTKLGDSETVDMQINVDRSKYVEKDVTKLGENEPADMQINVDGSKDVVVEDMKLGDNEPADMQMNINGSKDVVEVRKLGDNEPADMQINVDGSKDVVVEDTKLEDSESENAHLKDTQLKAGDFDVENTKLKFDGPDVTPHSKDNSVGEDTEKQDLSHLKNQRNFTSGESAARKDTQQETCMPNEYETIDTQLKHTQSQDNIELPNHTPEHSQIEDVKEPNNCGQTEDTGSKDCDPKDVWFQLNVKRLENDRKQRKRKRSVEDIEDDMSVIPKVVIKKTSSKQYESFLRLNEGLVPVVRLVRSKSLDEMAMNYWKGNQSVSSQIIESELRSLKRSATVSNSEIVPKRSYYDFQVNCIPEIENGVPEATKSRTKNSDDWEEEFNQDTISDYVSSPEYSRNELHHCLLCHRSYPTAELYDIHINGKLHRHVELVQRKTIHVMYRHFTGYDCPNLRPLSSKERKKMKWRPRNSNTNHFYQLTPLQIALQKPVLPPEEYQT